MNRRPARSLVVMKFGGTSVATPEKIRKVARLVVRARRSGHRVIVVVSAMGDSTDELAALARSVTDLPRARELDMLLTAGERISMALLSMAICDLGCEAVSFTGSQVGIITDERHTDARILDIRGQRLRAALARGQIPIVAGFQGVSERRKEITTLGRGGSDTTAVALAAALKAERCEIFTDVAGVFTEDPRQFPDARRLARLSAPEMAELARTGAVVVHPRACILAERYAVPLVVRSTFDPKGRTMIVPCATTERALVRGISHQRGLCRVIFESVPRNPRLLSTVVTRLAETGVRPAFFAHGVPRNRRFDLALIIAQPELDRARPLLGRLARRIRARRLVVQSELAAISLVGPGIGADPVLLARLFETLGRLRVHIDAFAASEFRVTCYVAEKGIERTIRRLMTQFDLGA